MTKWIPFRQGVIRHTICILSRDASPSVDGNGIHGPCLAWKIMSLGKEKVGWTYIASHGKSNIPTQGRGMDLTLRRQLDFPNRSILYLSPCLESRNPDRTKIRIENRFETFFLVNPNRKVPKFCKVYNIVTELIKFYVFLSIFFLILNFWFLFLFLIFVLLVQITNVQFSITVALLTTAM